MDSHKLMDVSLSKAGTGHSYSGQEVVNNFVKDEREQFKVLRALGADIPSVPLPLRGLLPQQQLRLPYHHMVTLCF